MFNASFCVGQAPAKGKGKENAAQNGAAARVLADMQSLEYEANMKEAAARGYGKLYAVFGGGQDGLHACAAGTRPQPSVWCMYQGPGAQ